MELSETGRRFVVHWGEMGSAWGVNRTVAQIHALLFFHGKPLNAEEMMAWCKERISHHKVPGRIRIVEEFPMTVTGKIQKFAMREAEQQEAAEVIQPPAAAAPTTAPAT